MTRIAKPARRSSLPSSAHRSSGQRLVLWRDPGQRATILPAMPAHAR